MKKVIVPVTVSKPEFDDYYTANQYAGWNEGILSSVIDNSTQDAPKVEMSDKLYTVNKKADGSPMTSGNLAYTFKYTGYDGSSQSGKSTSDFNNISTDALKIVKDGVLKVTSYTVKANKEVVTVNALTNNGVATDNAISVSKEFTMKLAPAFNKAKLVYYTDGVAGTVAAVGVDNVIATLSGDGTKDNKYNGLALEYGDEILAVNSGKIGQTTTEKLNNYTILDASGTAAEGVVKIELSLAENSLGELESTPLTATGVALKALAPGNSGKLIVTFTDYAGIKTQATIEYKK